MQKRHFFFFFFFFFWGGGGGGGGLAKLGMRLIRWDPTSLSDVPVKDRTRDLLLDGAGFFRPSFLALGLSSDDLSQVKKKKKKRYSRCAAKTHSLNKIDDQKDSCNQKLSFLLKSARRRYKTSTANFFEVHFFPFSLLRSLIKVIPLAIA